MGNALKLRDPEKITPLVVRQQLQMVEAYVEEADEVGVDAALDWLRQLEASRRHRSHHPQASRVERLYEVKWGELHPAEQGKRTDLGETSRRDLEVDGKTSSQFRKMAAHRDIVVDFVKAAIPKDQATPRSKILEEIKKAKKEEKREEREERRKQIDALTATEKEELDSLCEIRACSMQELLASGIQPDCIITDPPYVKKYLSVYGNLAEAAKDIPLVAVMCGQSYLPDIMEAMCKHLAYRWTMAYLTPGGQAVQQWRAKVNTFWKPVLLFGRSDEWLGDVARSLPNDNDKRFHEWGQSESGMFDLVEKLTKPGQLVCDPFCGGGTTGIVSLALGCRFIGCDIDDKMVQKAKARIEVMYAEH